jgi:hypothetical protein
MIQSLCALMTFCYKKSIFHSLFCVFRQKWREKKKKKRNPSIIILSFQLRLFVSLFYFSQTNQGLNVLSVLLIWLATTYNILMLRNNVILNIVISDVASLLDEIKIISWMWFTSRFGRKSCIHFSCWCIDLMAYIINI